MRVNGNPYIKKIKINCNLQNIDLELKANEYLFKLMQLQ